MSTCKTKPCSCLDTGLTTNSPCAQNTPDCPNPELCPETFSGECIVYTGDTILDANIQYGDRFNEIVQKLVLMILNPTCIDPSSTCLSALGVMSTSITSTSATIKWNTVSTAVTYTLEYKLSTAMSWTLVAGIPQTAYPEQIITGLVPNSYYDIRINSICGGGSCYSLTIVILTKLI